MGYQHMEPVSRQLTIVVGLTVVGFMAFGLALSFYRNALFEQTLESIEEQNDDLRERIAGGYRDLEYYESAQYKDKYAKESLGLVNPGEKVLIISDQPMPGFATEEQSMAAQEQKDEAFLELLRQMPVWEHWQLYLFHPDRIEGLKEGL